MQPFDVKQPGPNACRQKSFRYFLKVDGVSKQVCKEALLSLLNIGRKKLDLIRNQITAGNTAPHKDNRGHHYNRPNVTTEENKRIVLGHIKSFPTEMSHYSRNKNSHRLYLSPMLSINKMYDLYKEYCEKNSLTVVTNGMYRKLFVTECNLGFGTPKSDTCKVCDAGESNDEHILKFKAAFEQQKKDRDLGRTGNFMYITFDMQKTLPLPKISTSIAFYLRQVWLYNLGVHCITKKEKLGRGYFHLWTEDRGGRGPEEIGSCLLSFFETIEEKPNHLIAWSDSAGGQNKNFFIICLWHYLVKQSVFMIIDHKFPEVGHTFIDSDRDFAAVEKTVRKVQNIYTVDQYMTLMRESRKKNPFVITRMEDKFVDVKKLPKKLNLINRKKSDSGEKILFRNVRWIRVDEFGKTKYRYSLDETEEWKEVTIRKNKTTRTDNQQHVESPYVIPIDKSRAIGAKKFNNIQEQLKFIPENFRGFYNNLRKGEDD